MGKKDVKKMSSIEGETKVEAGNGDNVKVDAPEARYQVDQTVSRVADTKKTETADSNLIAKKVKSSGGELKQEVAARVVSGKGFGGAGSDVATANSF